MKRVVLVVMLLAAHAVNAWCNEAREWYDKGLDAVDPKYKIECYTKALSFEAQDDEKARIFNNRGTVYLKIGRLDQAIPDFSKAIQLNPKFDLAHTNRGVSYYSQDKFDEAIKDLDIAIELNPDLAQAYGTRGKAYIGKESYNKGIQDLDKAIELNRFVSDFYDYRGYAYQEKLEIDKAIANYNKSIQVKPDNSWTYYSRGIMYFNKREYDKAIKDYDKALELEPNFVWVYRDRGFLYQQLGDFTKAFQDYNRLVALEPTHEYANIWRFITSKRADGPIEEGGKLEAFRKSLDTKEWIYPVIALFGGIITPDACLEAAKHSDAKIQQEQLCEAYFYVGEYYLLQDNKEKAASMFKKSMETGLTAFDEYKLSKAELTRL